MLVKNPCIKKSIKYRNKLTNIKIEVDSDDEITIKSDLSEIDNEIDDEIDSVVEDFNKLNIKFKDYNSEIITKYIVHDKITNFNSKSIMCYYLWSGIEELDRWELNRKINLEQVKKIYKEMVTDYQKFNEFIFYEPVHLAIKTNSIFYV